MSSWPIRLYFITDRKNTLGRPLVEVVRAALKGGVDAVQLREKDLSTRELRELASKLLTICHEHDARLLINDRIDVALAIGADGVHLPADSFACRDARRLMGKKLVAVSAHNVDEVVHAAEEKADFVVLGPIYATPSKATYGAPLGPLPLAEASRRVSIPVLALGGIGPSEIPEVCSNGASGVGVVRGISSAVDVRAAATTLRNAVLGCQLSAFRCR